MTQILGRNCNDQIELVSEQHPTEAEWQWLVKHCGSVRKKVAVAENTQTGRFVQVWVIQCTAAKHTQLIIQIRWPQPDHLVLCRPKSKPTI
jgi:hypothetical protein